MSAQLTQDLHISHANQSHHFRICVSNASPLGELQRYIKDYEIPCWTRIADHSVFSSFTEFLSVLRINEQLLLDWLSKKTSTKDFRRTLTVLKQYHNEAAKIRDELDRKHKHSRYIDAAKRGRDGDAQRFQFELQQLGVQIENPWILREKQWAEFRDNRLIDQLRGELPPESLEMAMLDAYAVHGHNPTPLLYALNDLLVRGIGDEISRSKLSHLIDEIQSRCDLAAETVFDPPEVNTWLLSVLRAVAKCDASALDRLHFREREADDH